MPRRHMDLLQVHIKTVRVDVIRPGQVEFCAREQNWKMRMNGEYINDTDAIPV